MKLLDILVEHYDEWVFTFDYVAMDFKNVEQDLFSYSEVPLIPVNNTDFWDSDGASFSFETCSLPLADDWDTAVVTRQMFEEAKKLNKQ